MPAICKSRGCRWSLAALAVMLVTVLASADASATAGAPVVARISHVSSTTTSTRTADGNTFVTLDRRRRSRARSPGREPTRC